MGTSLFFKKSSRPRLLTRILAGVVCVTLDLLPVTSAMAQIGTPPTVSGGIVNNSGLIPFEQAFFAFEVESPLGTLKEVPIWDEIELMLDNPYQYALEPSVALGGTEPNAQGYPAYRLTQPRRRSFIYRNGAGQPCAPGSVGCTQQLLNRHVIHPLNYNHMNGEEMRLLNIGYVGGPAEVAGPLLPVPGQPGSYAFTYVDIDVEPGELRVEDDETAPDFNSPIGPRTAFSAPADCTNAGPFTECSIVAVDAFYSPGPHPYSPGTIATGEGALITGGQPGEPGYLGFGTTGGPAQRANAYSLPAVPLAGPGVPGGSLPVAQRVPGTPIPANKRLFDPVRGYIQPRPDAGAAGGLRRPSLRARGFGEVPPPHAGTPAAPDYLVNSEASLAADPAALLPSNENDYYRGATRAQKLAAREAAATLGKAFFWDMQVGSDSVQSCATCHFHAGVDNRTKAQINSGVNAGDTTTITVQFTENGTPAGANAEVTAASFPLNKAVDPNVSADLLATPGSAVRTTNDVLSSMGVSRFKLFVDIPPIGTFLPAGASGVASLPRDIGCGDPGETTGCVAPLDPVEINRGFRRIEPRHTPTFFGATLNFDNFWDGRARHDFNGGSVFGPSDPQSHVMVNDGGTLVATRQIIRFASLASLATGPALSEFEMSFVGRNHAKLGKRLLQGAGSGAGRVGAVTPLANQLVNIGDSVLGLYSNQGGSACAALPAVDRSPSWTAAGVANKPGLCISYPGLTRRAFYPALWDNTSQHLNGCYTDGDAIRHPNQCAAGSVAIPVLQDLNGDGNGDVLVDSAADPFDQYVLTIAAGAAAAADTNQFTQMEANQALFWGLSIHAWGTILMPDDTPFDRFMDENPETHVTFGESGEPNLVLDLVNCGPGVTQPCFTEVENFKRDPGVFARIDCSIEGGICTEVPAGGSRAPGSVDPLMGLDFFLGSNLSLKNPFFRSLRCGECHAGSTLTDHTVEISHQLSFGDFIQEFRTGQPGSELFPEPLGHGRVITGFSLEGELQENAQDGIERNLNDFCTIAPCQDVYGNPVPGTPANGFPQGQSLFDNGVYNIGVTPTGEDISRGNNDAFGWPMSLSRLALKNLCGVDYSSGGHDASNGFAQPPSPGIPCPTFDPTIDTTGGGVYDPSAQDQQINPGFAEEPINPLLPPYLSPWASNLNVGDESNQDELFVGVNTLMREPMLEGFVDAWGPFNPAAVIGESMNNARQPEMATWPNVNRVNVQGAFKAAPLRNVEKTNPYFHDGGNLTLRQQLDFYMRGGNFPITNKAHRDFLIMNLRLEDEALGGCILPPVPPSTLGRAVPPDLTGACPVDSSPQFTAAEKEEIIVSVVDFLLELTDERVAFERAPFDHPEVFVPLDGTAPENGVLATVPGNREGLLANMAGVCTDSATGLPFPGATAPCFKQSPAVGAGGNAVELPNFLDIASEPRLVGADADCLVVNNHYCR
jgi:cytochrome c peroxidase